MRYHLTALLRKKPTYLVLHACTNDASVKDKSAEEIYENLINLKTYAEEQLPSVKVIISCPIIRKDNPTANIKVIHIRAMLRTSGLDIITNENVGPEYLGKQGLHLSEKGNGKFAVNLITCLKRL